MSSLERRLPIADAAITLQFGMDGSASGSDGCNRYTTMYNQLGPSLTFGQPMAGTMMACAEPIMTQAAEYQKALASVTKFTMSARQLVLFAGDDIVLTYIADVQKLEGTTWSVVNYNNGREAVVGVLTGTDITLNFDKDELNGNAGCNNYFGGYEIEGNEIKVAPLGSTMRMCDTPDGVMEQEQQYLAALQTATTFRIEGDQLWLRTAADAIAVIAVKEQIVDLPAPEPQKPDRHGDRGERAQHPLRAWHQLPGDRGRTPGRHGHDRWPQPGRPLVGGRRAVAARRHGLGIRRFRDRDQCGERAGDRVAADPGAHADSHPAHAGAAHARAAHPAAHRDRHHDPTAIRPDQLLGRSHADQPGRVRDAQLERPERPGRVGLPPRFGLQRVPAHGRGERAGVPCR